MEDVVEFQNMFKEMDLARKHMAECKNNLKIYFDSLQSMLKQYLFRHRNDNVVKSLNDLVNISYNKPNVIIPYSRSIRIAVERYYQIHHKMKQVDKKFIIVLKKYYQLCNIKADKIKNLFNKITDLKKRTYYLNLHAKFFKYRRVYEMKEPSKGEIEIMHFLDSIADNYDFYYFHSCRWDFCKDKKKLEYDFYCCLFYEDRVLHWIIEFDGDQHRKRNNLYDFESNHIHDIMKQYYLFHLNIPLLRIEDKHDIGTSIINFINDILISDNYVLHNPIKPIIKLFQDKKQHVGLDIFNRYCQKMHDKCIFIRKNKIKLVTNLISIMDIDPFYQIKNKSIMINFKCKAEKKNSVIIL